MWREGFLSIMREYVCFYMIHWGVFRVTLILRGRGDTVYWHMYA